MLYVPLTLNSFFLKVISWRPIISGSIGPIFIEFSPYGRYMVVNYWFDLLFLVGQGTLPWQQILGSKLAKSADSTPFVVLCSWHTLQKLAPETGARKMASVSGASVIQSGAEFFWRQILESDRTCSISWQNLATTWSKYWFVIGQCSMLLFSFVGVVNFVCIFDYWNYFTYSVDLTGVGWIAR